MQVPVQVTFRDMPVSDAVEALCHKEADKLERFCGRITSCRVVVAESHRRHHKGNLFDIRIDVTIPGGEIVVNREPPEHHRDEDVFVALREAFDRVRRQLDARTERRRGEVKSHEPQPHGRVARLGADGDHGFIETSDGRQVYFHRHSVLNGAFDRLEVGDEVRFVEESGEQGPQATSVTPVGRQHRAGLPGQPGPET